MRKFHSYGPINSRYHYCVNRKKLIETCTEQLIGIPEEGGHYFTIWGPRQTGNIIDQAVSMFRDMFLSMDNYILHGLALIGVRAVLGVDSKKG